MYVAEVAEQEALVTGVCSLLSGQPFYRASARSPMALAALITALLGSAGHQSPKAAQVIASMFITFSVGFIRPPALSYAQVAHLTCQAQIPGILAEQQLSTARALWWLGDEQAKMMPPEQNLQLLLALLQLEAAFCWLTSLCWHQYLLVRALLPVSLTV